jgi:thiol-disulfide isomerase/thioredoxin
MTFVVAFALLVPGFDEEKPDVKIELKDASLKDLEKHVAKHKGKPIAMDTWATWCVPCREKFPKFVKLAEKHRGKANFLSLTIDDEDKIAEAKAFLEAKKAKMPNFRLTDDAEKFEKKFDHEGVPFYVVWNAEGKIVLKTDDLAKVEKKVEELLAKSESEPSK